MRKIIWMLALVLAAGCAGTAFKWDDARKITEGMTTAEVERLVGPPNTIKSADGLLIYVWVYVNGLNGTTRTLRVDFKDGKVVAAPPIPDSFK
jgi:hypothetical protein